MMAVDCENNVITRSTIVKIKDKNSPLKGQLGEIRAMHKELLYIWVKNTLLSQSNGFYCTHAKNVLNAGAQHLKEANQAAGISIGDNQAHLDRNKKESLLRNQLVIISKGPLKGYKGSIIFANETVAEVHIHAHGAKYSIPRSDIFIVFNEMDGVRIQQNALDQPMRISFDDAAN